MKQIYIIEHLEPTIGRWCLIEYKHISEMVGKDNLWFTNIKKGSKQLEKFGKVIKESVSELKLNDACVLDPEADIMLTPDDSKQFEYFIFGGILGDYPPRKRTKEELSRFIDCEKRNIGKEQMSTDNAIFVVKEIINGKEIKDLKFQDELVIHINDVESTILPYRYNLVNGKPLVSEELVKFLKKKRKM